jgi:hypothetical protein
MVVPPLQPGVVGQYPVRVVWLSNHLALQGAGSYLDFLGHNWWPAVPGVQDLDSGSLTAPQGGSTMGHSEGGSLTTLLAANYLSDDSGSSNHSTCGPNNSSRPTHDPFCPTDSSELAATFCCFFGCDHPISLVAHPDVVILAMT